ncbi:MAG: radical SAM protein [Nanoarchaeota archaeon]|nr:radical SAM protein [Nanoarchaeota archaeon]
MHEFGNLNILKPQLFTTEEEIEAIKNTMTLDLSFGNDKFLEDFAEKFQDCKPWAKEHLDYLHSLSEEELRQEVERAKPKSILITPIMLTGECNANCEVCYTNRRKRENELDWNEIKEIVDQTHRLGSKTIYVAGEGEPTLDKSFFKILDYSKEIGMDIIMFTNGVLLSNNSLCQKRLNISNEKLAKRIADAPVYVYHKFWSADPEKNHHLMGLPSHVIYNFTEFQEGNGRKIQIPKGLELLLKHLPKERIGVESYVEKRTASEIKDTIIPFIKQSGVKSYIEPLIHSGKNFDIHKYDPTPKQLRELQPWLVRQGCTRVAYIFAVHNNGYATPGISISPDNLKTVEGYENLNIRNPNGTIKNLFKLRHTHPFLVENRYRITGCLCEEFNLEVAKKLKRV